LQGACKSFFEVMPQHIEWTWQPAGLENELFVHPHHTNPSFAGDAEFLHGMIHWNLTDVQHG
jgi:hypothetical protein